RPSRRGAFAERRRGNHRHRARREFEGAKQPREPAADDDDVAGIIDHIVMLLRHVYLLSLTPGRADVVQFLRSIIRCTDRRARSAIAGSMVTSSRRPSRLSKIFGSVIRFMCGHKLHGRIISISGSSAWTLSAIE